MTNQSVSVITATRLGLEQITFIDDNVNDDEALICAADYRNHVVYLVRGADRFEIHQSDLAATIRALTKFAGE